MVAVEEGSLLHCRLVGAHHHRVARFPHYHLSGFPVPEVVWDSLVFPEPPVPQGQEGHIHTAALVEEVQSVELVLVAPVWSGVPQDIPVLQEEEEGFSLHYHLLDFLVLLVSLGVSEWEGEGLVFRNHHMEVLFLRCHLLEAPV